jgi:hypothetical protein
MRAKVISGICTFETCGRALRMPVYWGRLEVVSPRVRTTRLTPFGRQQPPKDAPWGRPSAFCMSGLGLHCFRRTASMTPLPKG